MKNRSLDSLLLLLFPSYLFQKINIWVAQVVQQEKTENPMVAKAMAVVRPEVAIE